LGPISWVRSWAIRSASRVLTPGIAASEAVLEISPRAKIIQAFNSIDVKHFTRASERPNPTVGHRYLFVGQLIARKNIDTVMQTFAAIRSPKDSLTIAGFGPDESLLRELADTLGVSTQVRFAGRIEYADLPAVYEDHDTLVLASTNEVWGLVGNEALSMGLHFVVSSDCGIAESVQDLPGVFVFSNEDPEGLAQAMKMSREKFDGPLKAEEIRQLSGPRRFIEDFMTGLGIIQ
jgi:glycosyltransferase involved in cell wall biosynthesis